MARDTNAGVKVFVVSAVPHRGLGNHLLRGICRLDDRAIDNVAGSSSLYLWSVLASSMPVEQEHTPLEYSGWLDSPAKPSRTMPPSV